MRIRYAKIMVREIFTYHGWSNNSVTDANAEWNRAFCFPHFRVHIAGFFISNGRWDSPSHENDCREFALSDSTGNINRTSAHTYLPSRESILRCRCVTFDVYTPACILCFCWKKKKSIQNMSASLWWNISTETSRARIFNYCLDFAHIQPKVDISKLMRYLKHIQRVLYDIMLLIC